MKIRCLICNDILDPATSHGFIECKCGACHIDNIGNNLTRIGGDFNKIVQGFKGLHDVILEGSDAVKDLVRKYLKDTTEEKLI